MRYAHLIYPLNQMRLLTRGSPLGLRNQLTHIRPDLEVCTLVLEGSANPPGYAQIRQYSSEHYASLSFAILSPMQIAQKLPVLLDDLTAQAGEWHAIALLADTPHSSPLLPSFRRAAFITWARQTVFQIKHRGGARAQTTWGWRSWKAADLPAMQSLHHRLVPGQFQMIEPVTRKRLQGMVLADAQGRLLAYADLDQGPKGFWAQVFALPEMNEPAALQALEACVSAHYDLLGRPFYVACRSYQPWLQELAAPIAEAELEEQDLLVRYLARFARDEATNYATEALPVAAGLPVAQISQDPPSLP